MSYVERTLIVLTLFVFLAGVAYVASFFLDQIAEAFDDEALAERGEKRCAEDSRLAGNSTDALGQRGAK